MSQVMADGTKYQEKSAKTKNGYLFLFFDIVLFLVAIAGFIASGMAIDKNEGYGIAFMVAAILILILAIFLTVGFKVVNPNEAVVLTLFGKYYGTIKKDGFYWTNPFCTSMNPSADPVKPGRTSKISLKTMTLNNEKQTVNDERGNPIIIGTIVIWRVVDTTKAVFSVQNYKTFLSTQCDSATRNISRMYPYDITEDSGDEKTLRGSSQEIADMMKKDLQIGRAHV